MRLCTALAIRHLAFEDLGRMKPWLQRRGFTRIQTLDAGIARLEEVNLDDVDLLVVLGGPISANDDVLYPHLRDTAALIARRLSSGRAIVGVCLGAQLMAKAMGASVGPMPHGRKEIGYAPVALTAAGLMSPLAALHNQVVLHWHGDQFALPEGLDSLAQTALCPNQAFMPHAHAIATQFHLEADARRIEQWLIGHTLELKLAGIDIAQLRRDAMHHGPALERAFERVMDDWLDLVEA